MKTLRHLLSWLTSLFRPNRKLVERVEILEKQLEDVRKLALDTVDLTGGEGWVEMVQGAVTHLDDRIDQLQVVLTNHQQAFEAIAQEENRIRAYALDPNNKLN